MKKSMYPLFEKNITNNGGTMPDTKKYVTKKLRLPQTQESEENRFFVIPSDERLFDTLFRKSTDFFVKADCFDIPLGTNPTEVVISLYGLQNDKIGFCERWQSLMHDWLEKRDPETAAEISLYLHARAVERILKKIMATEVQTTFEAIEATLRISDSFIVQQYFELVDQQ